jgi:NitT/TauT family transport system ATP-binding protein
LIGEEERQERIVEVRIAEKRFADPASGRERRILADLRLDLRRGEFVAVVGPSGCGKSTLLHLIAGLDTAFDGRVHWLGADVGARPRLGYVFQTPRLLPWLNVRDNIALVLDQPSRHRERIDALIRAMGLADFGHFHPHRLSVGMQRRAALARAFVTEPGLLLMDEPFVSLDAPTANQLRRLLLDVWDRDRSTVVLVTHDLREATTLADRILFMSACPAAIVADETVGVDRDRRSLESALEERYLELDRLFRRLYPAQEGATPSPR